MTSQEEWRRIAYERSLGEQGMPVGIMASQDAYRQVYLRRIEATNQFYDSISRSCSAGPSDFGIAPAPVTRDYGGRDYTRAESLSVGGSSTDRSSARLARRSAAPASRLVIALRITFLAVVLSGLGAGLWTGVTEDPRPAEVWKDAAWFGVRLAATAAVLLMSQLVSVLLELYLAASEIYAAASPLVAEAGNRLLELSLPWILGVIFAANFAITLFFWALRRLARSLPRWARLTGALAAALGVMAVIGPSWWPQHLLWSKVFIFWAKSEIGQLLLI